MPIVGMHGDVLKSAFVIYFSQQGSSPKLQHLLNYVVYFHIRERAEIVSYAVVHTGTLWVEEILYQAPFINAMLFGDGTDTTSMHKGVVARIKRAYYIGGPS